MKFKVLLVILASFVIVFNSMGQQNNVITLNDSLIKKLESTPLRLDQKGFLETALNNKYKLGKNGADLFKKSSLGLELFKSYEKKNKNSKLMVYGGASMFLGSLLLINTNNKTVLNSAEGIAGMGLCLNIIGFIKMLKAYPILPKALDERNKSIVQ